MKYFILAGEASGDKQAALLCQSIFKYDNNAVIQGWGGDDMIAHGVHVTKHYKELAFMGFVEVIKHLPEIFRNFKKCKREILDFNPNGLILVDYPGFNLRMAKWAYKHNITVYYYISPQLWAWHTSRVHNVRKSVRKMYVILPFEKEFYARYGVNVMYIGHPLAMSNDHHLKNISNSNQIALLPGSRKHEVSLILPEMIKAAALIPEYNFVVIAVKHLPESIYTDIVRNQTNVTISYHDMKDVLHDSSVAVVTSGTATLETALTGTPQVVVYKGNPFSYQIAKRLIKVPYISLVNLIAGKKLVPELIQDECNAPNIAKHLRHILSARIHTQIQEEYKYVVSQLIEGGGPDAAAADIISDLRLRNNN